MKKFKQITKMKKTYNEILEILSKEIEYDGDFASDDYKYREDIDISELGEIVQVASYGGEGKGDEWYSVKYFKDHDVFIKIEGWYSSYSGTNFNGWDSSCSEVKPIEKTITVYK